MSFRLFVDVDEDRIFVAKLHIFLFFVFWLHGQKSLASFMFD